jgi:teichuronic acid biosynthesis glycosyltransferase TuaG
MPVVSVVIPAFNRTAFLKQAIESVESQTLSDWEIIVADDGSDLETHKYLESVAGPNLRVLWLEHSGNPSRVRNAAAAAAKGRYLAFLDSDDLWDPIKLEKQIAALRHRGQCRWSYTACRHITADGSVIPKKRPTLALAPEGWIFRQLLILQIGIAMPTVMVERQLFHQIGGFDEAQLFGEFHDLCLRLARASEVVVVREQLCSVRRHNQHYSSDHVADRIGWLQLYEKMLATSADPVERALCAKMRADASLALAVAFEELRDYRGARATLRGAIPFSWRYPHWWWGALKRVVRPVVPERLIDSMRQRRD